MAFSKLALTAVAALITSSAWAQPAPMPEDLAWKLLELGRTIDPPKTAALFAPMQQKEPFQGVKTEREIKYGPADRHLLDVFTPETNSSAQPVLIYIHGGGFIAGNKRAPGSPFYDNIMLWAANNGFVGVNATYRLAPQSPYPAGAEDIAAVVAWVAANISERGGDPTRIYLMGHSAGAVHLANYVSHPEFHKVKGGGLAGAVMVSGIYEMGASPLGDAEIAYFGSDPSRYAERSSLQGLLATKIPLMIAAAELDPPRFVEQFNLLKQASCKGANGCARATMLQQHSHMSEVYAINAVESRLADEILAFVKLGK
ncbi:alpha/beta hydrolase [Bradyrhizobium sp.]|uniref:alpha/beta hydrolase n=1 Tax=Bradyrhizobium sp. TaxID=376 RepID=UPI002C310AAB|nr:alpha/beta hydrolase [Bradyrhizobium sp.]HMM89761.1 alpha/beta hydrolase [Bradyrhizobium sp.]